MAEKTEVKYLDLAGLQRLWEKISEKFARRDALQDIIDALNDPYVRKSVYDGDITEIERRLDEIAAAANAMEDGDSIVRNEQNQLKTNIILDIDEQSKKLRLVTGDKKTPLSEIDYAPFVKDGMLNSVSIVVVPDDETAEESGKTPGTYIKFVFNTDAGKEAIYLDASEFINVYEGDDYISVVGDKIALNTVNLETFIEGYLAKSATITGITTTLDSHGATIQSLQVNIAEFESRIAKLEGDFENVSKEFTTVKQTVSEYDVRIGDLETAMETVPNTPITEAEIDEKCK